MHFFLKALGQQTEGGVLLPKLRVWEIYIWSRALRPLQPGMGDPGNCRSKSNFSKLSLKPTTLGLSKQQLPYASLMSNGGEAQKVL